MTTLKLLASMQLTLSENFLSKAIQELLLIYIRQLVWQVSLKF